MQMTNSLQPTVLLAEIGNSNSGDLEKTLRRFGWDYTRVSGSTESIDAGAEKNYDLIISDMQLSTQESVNWLRAFKARNPRQAIIVVAKTAGIGDALELFNAGATDLVTKPFNAVLFEQVAKRVVSVLQERLAEREVEHFLTFEKRIYKAPTHNINTTGFRLDLLERLLSSKVIDAATCYQLNLAFQEALANCVEHGNLELQSCWREEIGSDGQDKFSLLKKERLDNPHYADRIVTIAVEYDGKSLVLELSDQGPGFDASNIERDIRQHTGSHGRGLPIMFEVLDDVKYSDNGTKIRLTKFLTK